jgi:hypothetical protein
MAALNTLRNALASLVPAWLYADDGGKVLHAIATLIDASVQLDRDRTEVRFPRRASPSANKLTGQDRGIQRGRTESAAHYAERLIGWRYPRGHRVRGSAWALLEQVSEYFGGLKCSTIDVSGNRYTWTADGTESQTTGTAWVWDTIPTTSWARFWITLYSLPTGPLTAQRALTDPLVWSDGTIGVRGMTAQDASAIRNLFNRSPQTVPWNPGGTTPEWVIIGFDGTTELAPTSSYDRWSLPVAGTQTAVRNPAFRYFALNRAVHPYVEVATTFVAHVPLPDGTTYDGVVSYAGGMVFPDGSVHFDPGSPTFVTGVLLPDDASAVIGS